MNNNSVIQDIESGVQLVDTIIPSGDSNAFGIECIEISIIREPNLLEQPRFYQNTEFFSINPEEIVRC